MLVRACESASTYLKHFMLHQTHGLPKGQRQAGEIQSYTKEIEKHGTKIGNGREFWRSLVQALAKNRITAYTKPGSHGFVCMSQKKPHQQLREHIFWVDVTQCCIALPTGKLPHLNVSSVYISMCVSCISDLTYCLLSLLLQDTQISNCKFSRRDS